MPYRYAHYFVGFVLLVVVTGFWASYFAPIARPMPLGFHVHAITSIMWLLLLLVQSIAIHARQNPLHRQLGLASFALFPLLMLGFVMIINVSADRFGARESPFIAHVGPAFGLGMGGALVAYLTLFYLAMKHRHKVRLHAGYLLATPMILFESPFSRLMDAYFPWMNVIGSEGPQALLDTIVVSNTLVTIFALALYVRDRKNGAPWLLAAVFMTANSILMWFAPGWAWAGPLFDAYAAVPDAVSCALALGAGLAAGWLGWRAAPPRPGRREPREAAALA
ncbi:MAG: hypothetical protein NBV60_03390 [Erythrobacter sp.]|nr:hypothetical protein [Erythrobacter sp.]